MVRLQTLGTIDLRHEDGRRATSVLAQSKRLALLAYLVLDGAARHRRDTLLGVFWPDLDESRARHALSQSLHVLRRALGHDLIVTNGDGEVGIDRAALECDALELRQAAEAGDDENVVARYAGELLPGLAVSGAPEFERWLTAQRAGLRRLAADAARRLARRALEQDDARAAADFARRLLEIAPYDEPGIRLQVRALDRLGQRAQAIQSYARFVERLGADLDLEPGAETRALVERIRARDEDGETPGTAARAREAVPSPEPAPTPEAPPSPERAPLPSRSRRRTRPRLLAALAAVAVVLVAGSAAVLWSGGGVLPGISGPGATSAAASQEDEPFLAPNRLLVMPLRDETERAALAQFGRVAADWVIHGLHGTALVEVVSTEAVLGALASDSALAPGDPSAALEIARRMGAATALTGGYALVGDSLRIRMRLVDVRNGTVRGVVGPLNAPAAEPEGALEPLVERVMGLVASHHDARIDYPARWRSPPDYEAYEKFVHAVDMQRGFSAVTDSAAARLYRESYEADTTFLTPLVYAARTAITSNLLPGTADSLVAFLQPRRDRLAPVEQYELDAIDAQLRGDLDGRFEALRLASSLAPDRLTALAWAAAYSGRYQAALDAIGRVPQSEYGLGGWRLYTVANHFLGRHQEELVGARKALEQHPGSLRAYQMILWAYAGLGMADSIFDLYRTIRAHPDIAWHGSQMMPGPAKDWMLHGNDPVVADSLLREAENWFRRMITDPRADPCEPYLSLSETLQLMGRPADGLAVLDETIDNPELWQCGDWQPRADYSRLRVRGRLAAAAGEREVALAIADTLREMGPDSGGHLFNRAEIRAELGERDAALELLGKAIRAGFGYHYLHLSSMPFEPWFDDPAFQAFFEPRG